MAFCITFKTSFLWLRVVAVQVTVSLAAAVPPPTTVAEAAATAVTEAARETAIISTSIGGGWCQCIIFSSTELRSCSRLQSPANGTLHGSDTSHGAKANFACFTGFDLFGSTTLTCNNGVWSSSAPTCKGKLHSFFSDFRNTIDHLTENSLTLKKHSCQRDYNRSSYFRQFCLFSFIMSFKFQIDTATEIGILSEFYINSILYNVLQFCSSMRLVDS